MKVILYALVALITAGPALALDWKGNHHDHDFDHHHMGMPPPPPGKPPVIVPPVVTKPIVTSTTQTTTGPTPFPGYGAVTPFLRFQFWGYSTGGTIPYYGYHW